MKTTCILGKVSILFLLIFQSNFLNANCPVDNAGFTAAIVSNSPTNCCIKVKWTDAVGNQAEEYPNCTGSWNFGDGFTLNQPWGAVHCYDNPGIYTITHTVNQVGTETQNIDVGVCDDDVDDEDCGFDASYCIRTEDCNTYWNTPFFGSYEYCTSTYFNTTPGSGYTVSWDITYYNTNTESYFHSYGDGAVMNVFSWSTYRYIPILGYSIKVPFIFPVSICMTITDAEGCEETVCEQDCWVDPTTANPNGGSGETMFPDGKDERTLPRYGDDIQIYPNPAIDYLEVVIPMSYDFELFTTDGRLVAQGKNQNPLSRIDISSLSVSTYLLRIHTEEGSFVKKIIKK